MLRQFDSEEALTTLAQAAEAGEMVIVALKEVLSVHQLDKLNLFVCLNAERIDDATRAVVCDSNPDVL